MLSQLTDCCCKNTKELVILKSIKSIVSKHISDGDVTKYMTYQTDKAIGTKDEYMANNFEGESIIFQRAKALYQSCKDTFSDSLFLHCLLKTHFKGGEIKFIIVVFDTNFGDKCKNTELNIPSYNGDQYLQFTLRRMS